MSNVMMLGRLGEALPAGRGMGPKPWATYPGSGGPNETLAAGGIYPELRQNWISSPVSNPNTPNPQRIWNGGQDLSERQVSSGLPIRGFLLSGLAATPRRLLVNPSRGNKTSFTMGVLGLGALTQEETTASLAETVANRPDDLQPCLQRVGGTDGMTYAQLWQGRAVTLHVLGAVLGGYHGYKRNKKAIGWTALWAGAGFMFPVITTGLALVQGIGKGK